MKKYLVLVFVFVCFLAFTSSSFAQVNLKGGTYARVRHEFVKDWVDLQTSNSTLSKEGKDNRSYFRFKTSLWGQMDYGKELSLYAKLTNENRAYTYYVKTQAAGPQKKSFPYQFNEIFFDNLYLDIKNFLKMPVDLRLGRQDLLGQYGEGFLIFDGTPLDGTRSFWFDAAKAVWRIDPKSTLDLIYINQPKVDDILPIINRFHGQPAGTSPCAETTYPKLKPEQQLNRSDMQGFVLYHKTDYFKNLHLENYYIYVREESDLSAAKPNTKYKTTLNTFGQFAKYTISSWTLRGQFAYQTGEYGAFDWKSYGGYAFVDKSFKEKLWSPIFSTGMYYLSGDDRTTDHFEGFNPVFSRGNPMATELGMYIVMNDTDLYWWSNAQVYKLSMTLSPTKKTKLFVSYNYLRANQDPPAGSALFAYDGGKNRGQLPQMSLTYALNKNISFLLLAEYFIPGNFYRDKADTAVLTRSQVEVKF